MITPVMANIIMKRAFELINGHAPIKGSLLQGLLAGDFSNIGKSDIHATVSEMVVTGAIIEVRYQTLDTSGYLYFPAETSFEFSGRRPKVMLTGSSPNND
jgi:hypothetical protein